MRQDLTDITVVLDRSGSMSSVRGDTIGGFNTFLKTQREASGQARISLVQFDDHYYSLYTASDVKHAADLNGESYVPRGTTALLDAIGRTIEATGQRLAAMPESERPAKVLFVIITDGHENASKEWNRKKVFDAITHQRDTYKWDFIYLGANQDAIATATRDLGLGAGKSMTFAHNAMGTHEAFASVGNYGVRMRAASANVDTQFKPDDYDVQKQAGAPTA